MYNSQAASQMSYPSRGYTSYGSQVNSGTVNGGSVLPMAAGVAAGAAGVAGGAYIAGRDASDNGQIGSYPVAASDGSAPSTPATPFTPSSRALSPTASGAGADPLLQYIASNISNTSGGSGASRGPLAAWEIRFSEIQNETMRPIGEGSWGRVYFAMWRQTPVAVKILLDGGSGAESSLIRANNPIMARLEQEASIMSSLHHPNIVQFLGLCRNPAALVAEFCAKGSLTAVLQAARASPQAAAELTWPRRIAMAADAVRGMIHLHASSPPIIHRDLKSANMLVTASWVVKISDFNLSKILEETTKTTSAQAMNPRWLAPEVLQGIPASLASDVFSFGVVLWELMTWELPWGTANPWGIVSTVTGGGRLPIPAPADMPGAGSGAWPQLDRYIQLMNKCWCQEPSERPTFQEIIGELKALEPEAV